MCKIAILIRDLSKMGGGERNVITIVEALNEINLVPYIFSEFLVTPENIYKFSRKTINFKYQQLESHSLKKLMNEFLSNPIVTELKSYDCILDFTNKPPLLQHNLNYIKYIYVLNDTRTHSNTYLKVYKKIFETLGRLGMPKFNKFQPNITNVTQSRFIQTEINLKTGLIIPIIYPPVDINFFRSNRKEREKLVVSIGRFSYEKNHIEQLKIAKELPNFKFYIIGSFDKSCTKYYHNLKKYVSENNLKNVTLCTSLDLVEIKKILHNAMFFLHTTFEEHFGISTVEAIAAGCIPIVHNSGGQIEIVPFSELRFNDTTQAVKIIQKMQNADVAYYRNHLQSHIEQYDESKFKNEFIELISHVTNCG